jgi:NTP pyrophosphatase (non-canonical NTP hydrolase)
MRLTIQEVVEQSVARRDRWHHAGTEPWTGADWSNAMCGEAGEAANVVKKLRRHETRTTTPKDPDWDILLDNLGEELADTFLYLILVADHYGIELDPYIVKKFNLVSEQNGFPERIEVD